MKSRQSFIYEKACLWVFKFAFLSPLWYFGRHCKKLYKEQELFCLNMFVCLWINGGFLSVHFYFYFAFVSPFLCGDEWWPQVVQYPQIQKKKEKLGIQFIAKTKSRGPTQYETKTWSKNLTYSLSARTFISGSLQVKAGMTVKNHLSHVTTECTTIVPKRGETALQLPLSSPLFMCIARLTLNYGTPQIFVIIITIITIITQQSFQWVFFSNFVMHNEDHPHEESK